MAAGGVQVQQALGGVGVGAVAGVDYGYAVQAAGEEVGGAGVGMADDDGVDAHCLQSEAGVEEGFAFGDAAGAGGHIDDVGA